MSNNDNCEFDEKVQVVFTVCQVAFPQAFKHYENAVLAFQRNDILASMDAYMTFYNEGRKVLSDAAFSKADHLRDICKQGVMCVACAQPDKREHMIFKMMLGYGFHGFCVLSSKVFFFFFFFFFKKKKKHDLLFLRAS